MHLNSFIEFLNLFFTGLLAGSLLVIHYGVRTAIASQEASSQLRIRQALILRLRILIPALFIPAVLSGGAVAILDWTAPAFLFRNSGIALLIISFLTALFGTAPINKKILTWSKENLPEDWLIQVAGWEFLDAIRTWAVLFSFALNLAWTIDRVS